MQGFHPLQQQKLEIEVLSKHEGDEGASFFHRSTGLMAHLHCTKLLHMLLRTPHSHFIPIACMILTVTSVLQQ